MTYTTVGSFLPASLNQTHDLKKASVISNLPRSSKRNRRRIKSPIVCGEEERGRDNPGGIRFYLISEQVSTQNIERI
jgi:hypothetical protein